MVELEIIRGRKTSSQWHSREISQLEMWQTELLMRSDSIIALRYFTLHVRWIFACHMNESIHTLDKRISVIIPINLSYCNLAEFNCTGIYTSKYVSIALVNKLHKIPNTLYPERRICLTTNLYKNYKITRRRWYNSRRLQLLACLNI